MLRTSRRTLLQAAGLGGTAALVGAPAAAQARTYRPQYHFSVPEGWKNDPQRPVYVDGETRYYYLYNKDYPAPGTGTSWRVAASDDNVGFTDLGVAIPKETNPNGSIWSGCLVVDEHNTAGFGAGAVIAIATQEDRFATAPHRQAQFLFSSTDGGRTFGRLDEPVLPNPGVVDFRDPKVVWDDRFDRWVMVLAEFDKIGFYHSDDLRSWAYVGGFIRGGLGTFECPDLFWIDSDTGPGRWVLGASANTKGSGGVATFAYWTGDFDGTTFTPDHADPKWLDHGWDWYGAVTWERRTGSQLDTKTRYAIGWLNFWDYPDNTPTWETDGFNGTDSIVREITLHWSSATESALLSRPVRTLADRAARTVTLGDVQVNGNLPLDYRGRAYQVQTRVTWTQLNNVGFQLRLSGDGARHIDAGVYRLGDYAYLNRGYTGNPDPTGRWLESRTPFAPGRTEVDLRILVDNTSTEVFLDDGRYTHSSLTFPDPADDRLALFTDGGPAVFHDLTITEFDPV
ncbi:GH32 C-terminal domain-containing protein [Glycomyces sp. NPDC047369]